MRGSDYFEMSEFETFENKEPVWNWIPPPVTPGKLLTITDLKERWMKRQEEEKRHEEEKRRAEERVAREKVVRERSGEATMENRAADDRRRRERVENRGRSGFRGSKAVVDVEDDDVRYGNGDGEVTKMRNERKVDVRNTSRGKQVGGGNRGIHGRRWGGRRGFVGGRGGDLARVEKPEVEKEVLQLDDEKIDGDEQAVKHNPKLAGRYFSGKASLHNGRGVEAKVYERDENGVGGENVVEKKGGVLFEEVISEDDEHVTGQTCWYHSLTENQRSDGYWVCKFIRTVPETEAEESTQGSEVVEGNMVDTVKKKNCMKQQEVARQVGEVCGKERNDVTVDRVRKEVPEMDGEFSRMVSHGDKSRKPWQPWRKREMNMGVQEEVAVEQVKTEAVKVSEDNMFNQGGSYQKNDVRHKPLTVEPSVEIEEQFEASAVTDREANRKGKFKARSNAVDGIKLHGSGRFKAERNIGGSSAMEHPEEEALQVDSSHKRVINEVGSQVKNNGLTLKPETKEPMVHSSFEVEVKSEAPAGTGRMVDRSDDRNGDLKMYGDGRFKTERSFSPSTGGQVIKDAIHVNIDDPKIVNQDDKLTKNERVIISPVTVKPADAASDGTEKSETTEATESGTKTWVTKVDGRKMVKDLRFKTEKNFGYEGFNNSKKFNGRMKEVQLEKRGLVWVKKGEASVSNTGGED
uniref:Uncharacterized protein n=1 Tax=Kalanchoe fedtschenkoi TaxID=63787 RepID=A0A7N0TQ43_KALFE